MEDSARQKLSKDWGIELMSLDFIQENKYCVIYAATTNRGRKIIKKYKGDDIALAKAEMEALNYYHQVAQESGDLLDSWPCSLREDKNLLSIGFIEGEAFSSAIYRAAWNRSERERCVGLMRILGKTIRAIREATQLPDKETSPFIFEYFHYCSSRLNNMAALGPTVFRGLDSDARELAESFRSVNAVPSFIHGDFVFKNILVRDDKVGLIDFANSNRQSHPLNDIYNLRLALANMRIPRGFKADLKAGFVDGLGSMDFPETVRQFYYEYNRRRWLTLKLSSRNPKDLIQGVMGLLTFARPFSREVKLL